MINTSGTSRRKNEPMSQKFMDVLTPQTTLAHVDHEIFMAIENEDRRQDLGALDEVVLGVLDRHDARMFGQLDQRLGAERHLGG